MAQVTGILFVYLDGDLLETKEGSTKLQTGGAVKTPVMSGKRVAGHSRKTEPGVVATTVLHKAGVSAKALNEFQGTVTVECDTGARYVIADAECTKLVELSEGEGEMAVEFTGQPADEQT